MNPTNLREQPFELFKGAVQSGDAAGLRRVLADHPEIRSRIDERVFSFDMPAIGIAPGKNRETVDVLLEYGADINARSTWWAGGFGVLDGTEPAMAQYLISRGARVDIHAASHLGMIERVRELVSVNPELVHALGGDGQTALHFASTVEIAAYLLDRGADIDARDVDHESTPAQYMAGSRQDIARYLIGRGCTTDILMAAAVGDADLVRKHLDADPTSIQTRVSEEFFPKRNPHAGGSIYIWELGGNKSAHQVAAKFGHQEIVELLMDRSPAELKLTNACAMDDEARAKSVLAGNPHLVQALSATERNQIVNAAENNDAAAVRLMLECGWPVDGAGGTTPLHFAAWHGNAAMVKDILRYNPPLEQSDPNYNGKPLGWAVHGSENSWHRQTGDYGATVEALLQAGAEPPVEIGGSPAVREVLRRHR